MTPLQILALVQVALQLEPLALEAWVAMTNQLAGQSDQQILASEETNWKLIINAARAERGETPLA